MIISGHINFNALDDNGKRIIMLEPMPESLSEMEKAIEETGSKAEFIPIKEGTGNNSGKTFIKCQSKYPINLYENALFVEDKDTLSIEHIGKGSRVEMDVKLGEVEYRRKKTLCCYVRNINVLELVTPTIENPFDK